MNKQIYTITENREIATETYRLVLSGEDTVQGEFVHLDIPGYYLRRPISVCEAGNGRLTLLYKTVGEGTRTLATLPEGTTVSVLTGLGKGFDADACRHEALLVAGGLGAAPFAVLTTALVSFGLDCEIEITKKDGSVLNLNETPLGLKLEDLKEMAMDKAKGFVEEFKDVAAQNGAFQKEQPYNSPWPEDYPPPEAKADPEAPADEDAPAE